MDHSMRLTRIGWLTNLALISPFLKLPINQVNSPFLNTLARVFISVMCVWKRYCASRYSAAAFIPMPSLCLTCDLRIPLTIMYRYALTVAKGQPEDNQVAPDVEGACDAKNSGNRLLSRMPGPLPQWLCPRRC